MNITVCRNGWKTNWRIWWKGHIRQMLCSYPDVYPVHMRESIFFSTSKTFCVAASMSPDNFHSSAMHFSWHLQPCSITKKASTSLKWHLGPEWDILYQHYRMCMGTNIYSSFMEMLRKHRVRDTSTWRVLWDLGFALSVEANFSETQSCVNWFFLPISGSRFPKQADTQAAVTYYHLIKSRLTDGAIIWDVFLVTWRSLIFIVLYLFWCWFSKNFWEIFLGLWRQRV